MLSSGLHHHSGVLHLGLIPLAVPLLAAAAIAVAVVGGVNVPALPLPSGRAPAPQQAPAQCLPAQGLPTRCPEPARVSHAHHDTGGPDEVPPPPPAAAAAAAAAAGVAATARQAMVVPCLDHRRRPGLCLRRDRHADILGDQGPGPPASHPRNGQSSGHGNSRSDRVGPADPHWHRHWWAGQDAESMRRVRTPRDEGQWDCGVVRRRGLWVVVVSQLRFGEARFFPPFSR